MRARRGGVAAVGFVVGVAAGALVWGSQIQRFRRDLFSANVVRRLAALSYLRGQRDQTTAALLRDYVYWEQSPALRRRGQRILRRLERQIRS
jgi:hypothetical protein